MIKPFNFIWLLKSTAHLFNELMVKIMNSQSIQILAFFIDFKDIQSKKGILFTNLDSPSDPNIMNSPE